MVNEPGVEGALSAAELYTQYARFVARYLHRLGVPSAQVDDVVQEVFIVVHQRGGYRPGPAKPASYLATIAMHAASHARRGTRRREARRAAGEPDRHPTHTDAPDRGLALRDDVTLVRDALALLGPTLGTTLLLADGEDEPCTSIAAAMEVPVGTVYFRLHRARQKFADAIRKVEAARTHTPPGRAPFASPALARRMSIMGMFGMSRRAFEDEPAFTLLRQTGDTVGVEHDVEQGYTQHLAHVARGTPSPAWYAKLGSSALKMMTLGKGAALLVGLAIVASVYFPHEPVRTPVPPSGSVAAPGVAADARDVAEAPSPLELLAVEAAPASAVADARPPAARRTRATSRGKPLRMAREVAPAGTQPEARASAQEEEPRAAPEPARPPPVDVLATLAKAERLAQRDPDAALALLARAEASGAARVLAEEFAFIRLSAQYHAGQRAEVLGSAPGFLRTYPQSVFAPQVRTMLKQLEAAP